MPIGVSQAFHVTLNCSDMERSVHFYCELLGLTAAAHTRLDVSQDGTAYRLDRVQWDSRFLHDERGLGAGLAIDLLQWQTPKSTGRPSGATNRGLNRLGLYVTDLDDCYERLTAAGATTFGAPHATVVEGSPAVRTLVVEDPDGMLVELVGIGVTRVGFVSVGTADLDRARAFYEDVLGFLPMFDRAATRQPGDQLGLDGEIELAGAYFDDPRGKGACMLEVSQMLDPEPTGSAASAANQLGMFSLAFLTDDIDRDYAALVEREVPCWTPPVMFEASGRIPASRVLLFTDPDGTVLELLEPPH